MPDFLHRAARSPLTYSSIALVSAWAGSGGHFKMDWGAVSAIISALAVIATLMAGWNKFRSTIDQLVERVNYLIGSFDKHLEAFTNLTAKVYDHEARIAALEARVVALERG